MMLIRRPYACSASSAALACLALLSAAPLRAHDSPQVTRISWRPGSSYAVFQTQRGFVIGDTQARDYRWACVESLGLQAGEQPGFTVLQDGRWLAATERGLFMSANEGCSWAGVEGLPKLSVSALSAVQGSPGHLLVALAGAADGGLYESLDDGTTWRKRLDLASDDYVAQIAALPSDTAHIYLSGLVIDEQTDRFSFQLTRSTDSGQTWDRAYVPLTTDEDLAVLAAVSPSDPARLVVLAHNRQHEQEPDRVLYSRDRGATYREVMRDVGLTGASFVSSGQALLIAGPQGLVRIDRLDDQPMVGPAGVSQLVSCTQAGPEVGAHTTFACGHVNGFDPMTAGVFVSSDAGTTWSSVMAFTEVQQRVACDTEIAAQACKDQWIDWQLEIQVGVAGAPIDSVDGWRDFKGLTQGPPAERPHTLSTARRTQPSRAGSSAPLTTSPNVDTMLSTTAVESPRSPSNGCNALTSAYADAGATYLGASAVVLLCLAMRCRRRNHRSR